MAEAHIPPVSKDELMSAAAEVIDDFYPDMMTLRQVYYQLVSRLIIPNTQSAYKRLSAVLVEARERGVIPWDAMEDRTREIVGSPSLNEEDDPEERANLVVNYVQNSSGVDMDRWWGQDWYVEVWLEKQALEGVFESVTGRHEVVLMPGRGYSSATFLREAADRIQSAKWEDKSVAILYFGDYDPSGMDIERYGQEKLMEHGVSVDVFKRISLTLDQIKEFSLPPVPAKRSDSRRDAFVAIHGDIAVELDAIPVNALKTLIGQSIQEFWNSTTYDRRNERRRELVAIYREELVRGIRDLVSEWDEDL